MDGIDDVEKIHRLRREASDAEQPAQPAQSGWIEWNPSVAPHVRGRYEKRRFSRDGLPESQRVEATCQKCQARMVIDCATGIVRTHIARFAACHLHSDPLTRKV